LFESRQAGELCPNSPLLVAVGYRIGAVGKWETWVSFSTYP